MSSGAKDSIRQPLNHSLYQLCCLMHVKLGPHTGPRYWDKCPWQVRILLGCQQVKKHVAVPKIAYCSFPIMLVSKMNKAMKIKKEMGGGGEESSVYFGWSNDFSDQPEVYTKARPKPQLPFLPKVARVLVTLRFIWLFASWACSLKSNNQSTGSLQKFPNCS